MAGWLLVAQPLAVNQWVMVPFPTEGVSSQSCWLAGCSLLVRSLPPHRCRSLGCFCVCAFLPASQSVIDDVTNLIGRPTRDLPKSRD